MLRSIKALVGYSVLGTDGELGAANDFLFDDAEWKTRYLVVDTGTFFPGRKVLIPSSGLSEPQWSARTFPVNLTTEQIKNSPTVENDLPVSRQHEEAVFEHFQWVPYWAPQGLGNMTHPAAVPVAEETAGEGAAKTEEGDPHLRSLNEVTGYTILAQDGEVGHISDFIVDDADWMLRMIVAQTGNWLPGRSVLLAVEWIEDMDWLGKKAKFDLKKETIKDAPEFDPAEPVNRRVEERLYDYYGRPTRYVAR